MQILWWILRKNQVSFLLCVVIVFARCLFETGSIGMHVLLSQGIALYAVLEMRR